MKKDGWEKVSLPSGEKMKKEANELHKIFECYRYLREHTGSNEALTKKIEDLGREHMVSLIDEIRFVSEIAYQKRRQELEELLKKSNEREGKKT